MTARRGAVKASPETRVRRMAESWFITEPLLFAAFLTHRLAARPGHGTLRVGEGRVEYDPDFVDALSDRDLEEVLRLEGVRVVLKHPYVRRPAQGQIAYLASNITLREHVPTSLPLPSAKDVFGDDTLSKQYFELYCDRLADRGGSGGAGAAGAAGGAGGAGEGGGGARDPVASHFDPARGGDATELWQEDSLIREQIDDVIREAEIGGGWGTLPGSLVARILATLKPRLDYRRLLLAFRTSILSSRRELTRMKPSRRYGFVYMGSRHRLETRLLVAVDVSGSITDADLETSFSVINRLFQYGIESIDVLQFDVTIRGPVTTFTKRRPRVEVQGRGGTSFDPVIQYIDDHREYDGLVILTDGMAPRPKAPRNRHTRVIWLFHHESIYQRMHASLAHVGKAAFIKASPAR